jgi:hypothetical protein
MGNNRISNRKSESTFRLIHARRSEISKLNLLQRATPQCYIGSSQNTELHSIVQPPQLSWHTLNISRLAIYSQIPPLESYLWRDSGLTAPDYVSCWLATVEMLAASNGEPRILQTRIHRRSAGSETCRCGTSGRHSELTTERWTFKIRSTMQCYSGQIIRHTTAQSHFYLQLAISHTETRGSYYSPTR